MTEALIGGLYVLVGVAINAAVIKTVQWAGQR